MFCSLPCRPRRNLVVTAVSQEVIRFMFTPPVTCSLFAAKRLNMLWLQHKTSLSFCCTMFMVHFVTGLISSFNILRSLLRTLFYKNFLHYSTIFMYSYFCCLFLKSQISLPKYVNYAIHFFCRLIIQFYMLILQSDFFISINSYVITLYYSTINSCI